MMATALLVRDEMSAVIERDRSLSMDDMVTACRAIWNRTYKTKHQGSYFIPASDRSKQQMMDLVCSV